MVTAAKRLLEGLRLLRVGRIDDTFNDFAARFALMSVKFLYRQPLVEAFDDVLDALWEAMDTGLTVGVRRIAALMAEPKGEPARPPTRVNTVRDARLWEAAKCLVAEHYPCFSDDESYWRLMSQVFTRMKLRLGGRDEGGVEAVVNALLEKFGRLPNDERAQRRVKRLRRLMC